MRVKPRATASNISRYIALNNLIIYSSLFPAVNIRGKVNAYPCLPEHRRKDGSECLEWLNTLRFYLKSLPHDPGADNTTCYHVHWKALRSGRFLECI